MPAKSRAGTRVRPLPDWYASDLCAGHSVQNAVGGQVSNISLYNNAKDGSVLRVYMVDLFVNLTSTVRYETFYGVPPTTLEVEALGSIDPRIGSVWGLIYHGATASCFSTARGATVVLTGQTKTIAPGWPLAIVPPGYGFNLETGSINTQLEAGIFWLVSAD